MHSIRGMIKLNQNVEEYLEMDIGKTKGDYSQLIYNRAKVSTEFEKQNFRKLSVPFHTETTCKYELSLILYM